MKIRIPFSKRALDFTFSLTSGNWSEITGNAKTSAGINVSETAALQLPAVYACVTLLSKTMASLPLFVYKRLGENGKARAPDHQLYQLLHDEPNPEMSAMVWRETAMGHLLLWGNSYSEIEYDEFWRPKAIWPLRPDHTWPERDTKTGEIFYNTILANGHPVKLPAYRILHIPGFGFTGLLGKSPIGLMMETFGLSIAVIRYGGKFFSNGAKPSGVLEHTKSLSTEAKTRLANSFDIKYGGLENSHRTMVLEEGLTYKSIGIPPEAAQFLESRNFNVTEIARIFGVQPHLIGELSRSTIINFEHQGIEFCTLTILPYCVRFEQEYTRKFLNSKEKKKYFVEHLMDGLLRGDMATRYEAYSKAINNGWMCPDEARAKENQNPMPDGQGQNYRMPVNTIPADIARDFWQAKVIAGVKGGQTNEQQTNASA